MATNSSISTSPEDTGIDMRPPIGPPGWSQLVDVSRVNPYYIPNPFVISTGIWLLCCIFTTVWAGLTIRQNKSKTPITQSLAGWRYRLAMAFAIIAFSWAVFDDTYRIMNTWVEQRLFLAQFVGDFFWDLARISLLLSVYDLYFHLMQQSPLGSWKMCRMHFWRYKGVKISFCGLLILLAFLMMCLRIAYLSARVLNQSKTTNDDLYVQCNTVETAAVILCFIFDILYFLAGLEIILVASVLLARRKRKNGSGSKTIYINNLILIAGPFFLAVTFTLINTCIRTPPNTNLGDSFGPINDGADASFAAIQFTAILLGGVGVVLPLGGIVTVAKRADASMDRVERLTSDSLDQVLVGSNPNMNMEQAPAPPRPASSNYDDPESWGGSTRRPSHTV